MTLVASWQANPKPERRISSLKHISLLLDVLFNVLPHDSERKKGTRRVYVRPRKKKPTPTNQIPFNQRRPAQRPNSWKSIQLAIFWRTCPGKLMKSRKVEAMSSPILSPSYTRHLRVKAPLFRVNAVRRDTHTHVCTSTSICYTIQCKYLDAASWFRRFAIPSRSRYRYSHSSWLVPTTSTSCRCWKA